MLELKILVANTDPVETAYISEELRGWGCGVETASDGGDALEKCRRFRPHVVLSEIQQPRMDGRELLRQLMKEGDEPLFLLLVSPEDMEHAVSGVRDEGAFWFLERPVRLESLRTLIQKANSPARLDFADLCPNLNRDSAAFRSIIGNDHKIVEILQLISRVGPSTVNVLITGESGTGKELIARAVHEISNRAAGPFETLNCAAIPSTLIESELFGHERGAFTGAFDQRPGRFELAHRGTLFLDEIGEMAPDMQAKLLRVSEDLRVRRIGSSRHRQVDVRLIAATNRDPQMMVESGALRRDLYYRLAVVQIHLPPLRERKGDIPLIAKFLLAKLARNHECVARPLAEEVMECLAAYHWPGNIRELRNVLERALILAEDRPIGLRHLPATIFRPMRPAHSLLASPPSDVPWERSVVLPVGISMEEAQNRFIQATFESCERSTQEAARVLQLSKKTVQVHLRGMRNGKAG